MSEEDHPKPTAGQRPANTFRGSGGLNVAVWKHKSEDGPDQYSVKFERNFKAASGEFKSTTYLRANDLLRLQKVLDQADAWIEQDKMHQRGAHVTRQR